MINHLEKCVKNDGKSPSQRENTAITSRAASRSKSSPHLSKAASHATAVVLVTSTRRVSTPPRAERHGAAPAGPVVRKAAAVGLAGCGPRKPMGEKPTLAAGAWTRGEGWRTGRGGYSWAAFGCTGAEGARVVGGGDASSLTTGSDVEPRGRGAVRRGEEGNWLRFEGLHGVSAWSARTLPV